MTLYCIHRWTEWIPFSIDPEAKRIRTCMGLCKKNWKEGEEEPQVPIARSE